MDHERSWFHASKLLSFKIACLFLVQTCSSVCFQYYKSKVILPSHSRPETDFSENKCLVISCHMMLILRIMWHDHWTNSQHTICIRNMLGIWFLYTKDLSPNVLICFPNPLPPKKLYVFSLLLKLQIHMFLHKYDSFIQIIYILTITPLPTSLASVPFSISNKRRVLSWTSATINNCEVPLTILP